MNVLVYHENRPAFHDIYIYILTRLLLTFPAGMATDREAWTQGRERGTLTLLSSGYEIVHQARRVQTDADFILSYPNASHPIASSLSSPLSYHLSYSSIYLHHLIPSPLLGFFTIFFVFLGNVS